MNGLDRALARPPTWRAIVVLAIAIRVMFVIAPFDVLHPVDAHVLGQLVLHGDVPYRDFGLEYPPGSILAMLLPGPRAGLAGPVGARAPGRGVRGDRVVGPR